jgi:hypothetical protein
MPGALSQLQAWEIVFQENTLRTTTLDLSYVTKQEFISSLSYVAGDR